MSDSDFTPKLGRIRDPGRARALRHTQRVLGEAVKARPLQRPGHIGPNAFKRGLAQGAVSASGLFVPGTRRVIVKARYTRQKTGEMGAVRAHLRYIQRDGVTREGHPGKLYDAGSDDADGQAFVERSEHDPHQFRFIVSAEDSERLADPSMQSARGFGADLSRAVTERRDWLVSQDLGRARADGAFEMRTSAFARLRQRELQRVGQETAARVRALYQPVTPGQQIQGRVGETIEVPGGKVVVVHRAGDFTVVPWSRRLEQFRGREVVGTLGAHELMIGRTRGRIGPQR